MNSKNQFNIDIAESTLAEPVVKETSQKKETPGRLKNDRQGGHKGYRLGPASTHLKGKTNRKIKPSTGKIATGQSHPNNNC